MASNALDPNAIDTAGRPWGEIGQPPDDQTLRHEIAGTTEHLRFKARQLARRVKDKLTPRGAPMP